LAAAQGHAAAQERLNLLQAADAQTPIDYAQLLDNYLRAAQAGQALADFNVGLILANGWAGAPDLSQAAHHYQRAAQAGVAQAQNNAAVLQLTQAGTVAPDEHAHALASLQAAAAQQVPQALFNLSQFTSRSETSALECLRQAAQAGLAKAQFNLGWQIAFGPQADLASGKAWLEQAAAQDDPDALYTLARMHLRGQDQAADATAALNLYEKAAVLGDVGAQFNLGFMYANAQGTAQDYAQALHWYRCAAHQAPVALPPPLTLASATELPAPALPAPDASAQPQATLDPLRRAA
jgi:TPR repeat protein